MQNSEVTPKRQNGGYFRIVHKPTGTRKAGHNPAPAQSLGKLSAKSRPGPASRMYKFCIEQI